MSVPRYRVKFYGFTAQDAQTFFRNLAEVLGITPEAARALVLEAPAIIRENLDEASAQRLLKSITAIQGLCLLEGMDGSYAEQETPQDDWLTPLPEPKAEETKSSDSVQFRFWAGMVVAVVAILVCFAVVAYVSSYLTLNRGQTAVSSPTAGAETSAGVPDDSQTLGEQYQALQGRIDELAEQLASLQTEAGNRERQIKRVAGTLDSDPLDVRKQQQALQALRLEIASKESELRNLRTRRDGMSPRQ